MASSGQQQYGTKYVILPNGIYFIENVAFRGLFARGTGRDSGHGHHGTAPPVWVSKYDHNTDEEWEVTRIEEFRGCPLPTTDKKAYYLIRNVKTNLFAWSKDDPELGDPVLESTPRVWAIECLPINVDIRELPAYVITPHGSKEDVLFWGINPDRARLDSNSGEVYDPAIRLYENKQATTNHWWFRTVSSVENEYGIRVSSD